MTWNRSDSSDCNYFSSALSLCNKKKKVHWDSINNIVHVLSLVSEKMQKQNIMLNLIRNHKVHSAILLLIAKHVNFTWIVTVTITSLTWGIMSTTGLIYIFPYKLGSKRVNWSHNEITFIFFHWVLLRCLVQMNLKFHHQPRTLEVNWTFAHFEQCLLQEDNQNSETSHWVLWIIILKCICHKIFHCSLLVCTAETIALHIKSIYMQMFMFLWRQRETNLKTCNCIIEIHMY